MITVVEGRERERLEIVGEIDCHWRSWTSEIGGHVGDWRRTTVARGMVGGGGSVATM